MRVDMLLVAIAIIAIIIVVVIERPTSSKQACRASRGSCCWSLSKQPGVTCSQRAHIHQSQKTKKHEEGNIRDLSSWIDQ